MSWLSNLLVPDRSQQKVEFEHELNRILSGVMALEQPGSAAVPQPAAADRSISVNGARPALWMNHPEKHSGVVEGLRLIKNKLTSLRDKEGHKIFLFTGVDGKDGVSTVVFNLSLILARDLVDQKILLIDVNLSRPILHEVFSVSPKGGLMDYLLEGQCSSDIIKHSDLSNLDLVTVGTMSQKVTSPFDLLRFREFLDECRRSYDFVLFDSPPILRSSHCRILSPKVDGVVVVAGANVSRWEVLIEIRKQLELDGARVAGGVLNKRRFVIPKWAYRFI